MTLIPLAMIRPSKECIEAPSRIRPSVEISQAEFNEKYADSAKVGLISFSGDGVSNPQRIIKYTGPDPTSGRFILSN